MDVTKLPNVPALGDPAGIPEDGAATGAGAKQMGRSAPRYTSSTLQGSPLLAPAARDEDSGILPERKTVRSWMVSTVGLRWELLQTLLSVAACAIYVCDTYGLTRDEGGSKQSPPWVIVEYCFTGLFLVDYLLRGYAAANRLTYPFGRYALVDFFTIAPVFLEPLLQSESLSRGLAFLRFVRVLRVMRVLRSFGAVNNSMDAVGRGVTMLLLTLSSIMFLSAGMIHLAESDGNPNCVDTEDKECFTFGLALYFIVVTISTVGYGDVNPLTDEGRAIVMGMIAISLVVLPQQVDELLKLVAMRSRFKKPVKSDPGSPHVLVIGSVDSASVLGDLFKAFFHPDRLQGLDDLSHHRRLVVMGVNEPTHDMQTLLTDTRFEHRVQYVRGAVTSNEDLLRAGAADAEACFVLTDPHSRDPLEADKATLLRTLMVKNFRPSLQTLVHILDPGFEDILRQTAASKHDKVVCVDSLKAQLIAQSCLCPGFSTLVLNLVRMSKDVPDSSKGAWLEEYGAGCSREMYTVATPKCLNGRTFAEAVMAVYHAVHGQVIVWAVMDGSDGASSKGTRRYSMSELEAQMDAAEKAKSAVEPGGAHPTAAEAQSKAGEVIVNPGSDYRLCTGQRLLISATDQVMAHRVEDDASFATVDVPPPPPPDKLVYGVQPGTFSLREERKRKSKLKIHHMHTLATMGRIAATASGTSNRTDAHHAVVVERMNREEAKREEAKFEILQSRVLENCDFTDHIVIAGGTFGMDQLLELVADSGRKVVMISPMETRAVAELEELVMVHECLYIVRGSAFASASLTAAGISAAACFVILSDRSSADDLDGDVLDSSLLFTYLSVDSYRWENEMSAGFFILVSTSSRINLDVLDAKARMNRDALLSFSLPTPNRTASERSNVTGSMTDLRLAARSPRAMSPHAVHQGGPFLPVHEGEVPQAGTDLMSYDDQALFLPFFAAGYGFSTSTLHTLLAQAFYDAHVFRLVMALLAPQTSSSFGSQLTQIAVPEEFADGEFCDAFCTMLQRDGTVLVGVYRKPGTLGNTMPFVYTAPEANSILHRGDRLFAFIPRKPKPRRPKAGISVDELNRAMADSDGAASAGGAGAATGAAAAGGAQPRPFSDKR